MATLHFDMIRRSSPLKWWEISYPLACVQTEHHFSCHIKNEGMTIGENYSKTKAKNNGHFFALKVNFKTMSILAKKLSNFYHFKKDRRFLKKNIEYKFFIKVFLIVFSLPFALVITNLLMQTLFNLGTYTGTFLRFLYQIVVY